MNQANSTMPTSAWYKLQANNLSEINDISYRFGQEFINPSPALPGKSMRIRCIKNVNKTIHISDILWLQTKDDAPLYTIETGLEVFVISDAKTSLNSQELSVTSSHSIALVLLHQLLNHVSGVLDDIDNGLSTSMTILHAFLQNVGTNNTRGAEDMSDVDNHLSSLQQPLAEAILSLAHIEDAARRLRWGVYNNNSQLPLQLIDELIAEIEGIQRRAQFVLDRQRFHWSAAGEAITMSDLNVTKVFSVLWAAFIPGTALINWYGQNFEKMPELSWEGSLWIQLFAVLILTAIPIWMVKRSGTLR